MSHSKKSCGAGPPAKGPTGQALLGCPADSHRWGGGQAQVQEGGEVLLSLAWSKQRGREEWSPHILYSRHCSSRVSCLLVSSAV